MPGSPSGPPEPISRLIEHFHRLPGIGPKSAQRLAYYVLRCSPQEAAALATAISDVKERIRFCSVCFNITEAEPCGICADTERDQSLLCVVEEPLDIVAIERTGFRGVYHVLHGLLNPMDGKGPEDIRIKELVGRIQGGPVVEVIMAIDPSLEGEATAMYVHRLLTPHQVRTTRLARGLPSGADLEYTDDITLARAMEGRQELHS